jgi:hypothetical protein
LYELENATTVLPIIKEASNYDITIGIILGIVVTFIGTTLVERRKSRNFKNSIKTLIKLELSNYHKFLNELSDSKFINQNSIVIPAGNPLIVRIKQVLSANGKLNSSYYTTLTPETKGSVFSSSQLNALEEIYTKIHYFHVNSFALDQDAFSGFTISLTEVKDLINIIEKAKDKSNKITHTYFLEDSGTIDKKTIRLTAIAVVAGAFITIFYDLFGLWLTILLNAPEQAGLKTTTAGVLAIIAGLIIYWYYTKSLKLN